MNDALANALLPFSHLEYSVAIIDLYSNPDKIFGINLDSKRYPASVFKIFITAEILRTIEMGAYSLTDTIGIPQKDSFSYNPRLYPDDDRHGVIYNQIYTIDELLALCIGKSNNIATNTLVNLINRNNIKKYIIDPHGLINTALVPEFINEWSAPKKYQFKNTTYTTARDMALVMKLIERNEFVSEFVSRKLKVYMSNFETSRNDLSYLQKAFVYKKGGYLENNLYEPVHKSFYHKNGFGLEFTIRSLGSLLKKIFTKGYAFECVQNDVAVITGEKSHYAIAVFTQTKSLNPRKRFPFSKLANTIFEFMNKTY